VKLASLAPLLIVSLVAACGGVPQAIDRTVSFAPSDTEATFLAARADALGNPEDGRSGVHLIPDGPEALALRLILTERAERSIDAQYYILHNDTVGHLFAGQLLKAADRGVRVRLLLDDMYTAEYDPMTRALTGHPNIEVRLFNPFRRDISRLLGGLLEFGRINRRMHNKSMTFDNQVTIVGGRNIGDEYFAAQEETNYDDLDLLAAGPVVREVSAVFDDYWNSPYAVPAEAVIGERAEDLSLDEARVRLMQSYEAARGTEYGAALSHGIRQTVRSGNFELDWVPAEVFADPPDKAAGAPVRILAEDALPVLMSARSEVIVASAYFVPGPRGVALLSSLAQRGVRVVVLTNSLDSNDVEPVHGHYARYRKALLEAGLELWELKPDKNRPDRSLLDLGQSRSALHSKAFVLDRRAFFIGSFNWDPRSVNINTEMGILIDAPEIARDVVQRLEANLPDTAYRLELDSDADIRWLTREEGRWVAYKQEPSDSPWRKLRTDIYGVLPIGSQL
jgi:putative cardiolipin synthase